MLIAFVGKILDKITNLNIILDCPFTHNKIIPERTINEPITAKEIIPASSPPKSAVKARTNKAKPNNSIIAPTTLAALEGFFVEYFVCTPLIASMAISSLEVPVDLSSTILLSSISRLFVTISEFFNVWVFL